MTSTHVRLLTVCAECDREYSVKHSDFRSRFCSRGCYHVQRRRACGARTIAAFPNGFPRCSWCEQPIHDELARLQRRQYCSVLCANTARAVDRIWALRWSSAVPISTREIAWVAGIYEGEGTAHRRRGGNSDVRVSQKDNWILLKLRSLFGGSIHHRERVTRSRYGIYTWTITGAQARGFLMTVYAFLSPWRRSQARDALQRGRGKS